MSQALHYDWTDAPEAVRPSVPRHSGPRHFGPLALSLVLAVAAVAGSGSAVAWKWSQYESIDTAAIVDQSPVQVSLPPDEFADAEVVHGRLVVLTPPAYATGAINAVPTSAQVRSPVLADTLAADATSSAHIAGLTRDNAAVDATVASDEARHDADMAPADDQVVGHDDRPVPAETESF